MVRHGEIECPYQSLVLAKGRRRSIRRPTGADRVNPDNWETPATYFPNTKPDIDRHFTAQSIVINLTFRGDWAGNTYAQSGCSGTCGDYVNHNPNAFTDAYFDLVFLRIYKRQAPTMPTTVGSKVTGGMHLFQQVFRLTSQAPRK
jgi:hypothetical protein